MGFRTAIAPAVLLLLNFISLAALSKAHAKISETRAIQIAKACLASGHAVVRPHEVFTVTQETTPSGEKLWKVKADTEPPVPDGARFIKIHDSGQVEYITFGETRSFKFKDDRCY